MIDIAYIFPGQGAQYVGMGKDLYENYPQAKEVFDKANAILKIDLARLCFEGPQEELARTENCQPAILTASIAVLRIIGGDLSCALAPNPILGSDFSPKFSLGLSLGEYTALVAAGSMGFEDALGLVRKRGEFMEACAKKNPGKMACVIGMEMEAIEDLCRGIGCEIANLNCPGQIVVSGKMNNIELLASLAKEKGAKRVIMLDVSGPFHSSLMAPASDKLKDYIDKVQVAPPKISFISNVDAEVHTDPSKIRENLIRQVNSKTLWEKSILNAASKGIKTFLEIGPGSVLKGLLKKIDPSLEVKTLGTLQELQAFILSQS